MQCLYKSDYGPADPGFDPLAGHGRLIKGYEAHVGELAQAQNIGQLEAMERQLARGQKILWCEQGYSWVYRPHVTTFFDFALVFLILPWMVLRVLPRLNELRTARAGRKPQPAGEPR